MNTRTALLLIACVTMAAAPQLLAEDKVKAPDYYPLKAGTKWHYQVSVGAQKISIVNQISKVETINGQPLAVQQTLVQGNVTGTEHLSTTDKGVFRHRYNGAEVSPPIALIKYPIKNGDSWESDNKLGEQKAKVSCRAGSEEIEVPAGKYKAVTVTMEADIGGMKDMGGMKITTTYWFAAGVGIVKQVAEIAGQKITMELEKFEQGK